jgi:ribonuclease G
MIDEIIIASDGGGLRAALRTDGRLMEVLLEEDEGDAAVGDIYVGRVTAVMRGMEACFVDIGAEKAGFLSLAPRGDDAPAALDDVPTEGARVLVQVTKAAQMGKGAGLTRNVSLAGRFLVLTPYQERIAISRRIEDEALRARLTDILDSIDRPDGGGFIVRTAAADAGPEPLAADARALCARWQEIREAIGNVDVPSCLHGENRGLVPVLRDRAHAGLRRVIVDTPRLAEVAEAFFAAYLPECDVRIEVWDGPDPVFEAYGVEDDIATIWETDVWLPCGGSLIIEQTHAMVTIDVNTARNIGRSSHAATVLQTNLEAADEIARQLRLRNLGGLCVIDFIHMDSDEDEDEVLDALLDALEEDPAFIRATEFSELGLVELARRRGAGSLAERLAGREDADDA